MFCRVFEGYSAEFLEDVLKNILQKFCRISSGFGGGLCKIFRRYSAKSLEEYLQNF
jgi:hypothetical protein